MKKVFKNKKGFTLVELLITITVLGIITAIAIVAMTNISKKDIETQERIYEDALITAAKLYNDSYSVDTFGRNKYGCKKIPYSKLKNKDLIKTLESNQLECAYTEEKNGEEKDTSGLIVRKIEDNYYYETILWCKDKSTGKTIEEEGIDKKLYEIGDEYCNETANEDKNPPVVYYTNNNKRYFYSTKQNYRPIPKVWVYDDVSGLQVGKVKLDIEWKDLSNNNNTILNSRTNTYSISKPGRNLSPQTLALINDVTKSDGNGKYQLTVRANTVVDGAGHMVKGNTLAVVEQPKVNPSRVTKLVTHPDIFYVENSAPILSRTKDTQNWTKDTYTVTFTANDNNGKTVYSGIKKYTIKVVNNSTRRTIDNDITCGTATPETGIIKNNPKNSSQASRNCSILFGTGNYKDGSYTVETKVEDWAGNTNSSTNTYKYDGTKPTVTITRRSYNQYTWSANDTGYSGLSGYKNDKVAADPTSGWTAINPTTNSKTGTYTIPNAGTHYTHVRDAAGNTARASIAAYTVTRSQGAGTTLTTKFENSNGTAFTNNPVVLNGTPIYIAAKLNAGYEKLSIKYGSTAINSGTTKNTTAAVTISTSASKCAKGYWNDGTHATCQKCPNGYTSDVGATAQNRCYISVEGGKYIGTARSATKTACATGYYKGAHTVYYGSTSSCTQCPAGYRNGGAATAQTGCKRNVAAGKYIKTARATTDTACATGYYKEAHQVNYGSTSSCSQCPAGYRNGGAATAQTGCKRDVAAGKYIKTARATTDTACGTGYYKGAHQVNYGSTSSCTQCPAGYRNGAGTTAQSNCKKSVSCGYHVASARGDATKCGAGTYRTAHDVKYGDTSGCTSCGSGKTSDAGSCSSSNCRNTTTRIRLCRVGYTCINCTYDCHYALYYGTEFDAVSDGGYWRIKGGSYDGCTVSKNCVGATECSAAQCPG